MALRLRKVQPLFSGLAAYYPCLGWVCGELDASPSPTSRLLVAKSKAMAVATKSLSRCKLS